MSILSKRRDPLPSQEDEFIDHVLEIGGASETLAGRGRREVLVSA